MVDFNRIREENARKAAEKIAQTSKTSFGIPDAPAERKPRAEGRDRDEDLSMCELLAGKFRSNLNE